MRYILPGTLILIAAVCVVPAEAKLPLRKTKAERFLSTSGPRPEGPAKWFYIEGITAPVNNSPASSPAQTGFDNLTNGFAIQGPDFDTITKDNVIPTRSFNDGRFVFEEAETAAPWPWTYLQRAKLCGVPPECRYGRRQPDRRTPDGAYRR